MAGRNKYNVLERSITIHKTPGDCTGVAETRDHPELHPDAQAVDVLDDKHARWIVDIPDKGFSSWESEITGQEGWGHHLARQGRGRLRPRLGPPRPRTAWAGVELVVCGAPLRQPRHERDRQARGRCRRLHLQGPAQLQAAHGDGRWPRT